MDIPVPSVDVGMRRPQNNQMPSRHKGDFIRWTIAAVVLAGAVGVAQQADVASALERKSIASSRKSAFDPPRFGPARWLPDGTAYAIVERRAAVGRTARSEIARYDAATGARTVLVAGRASCLRVDKRRSTSTTTRGQRTAGACSSSRTRKKCGGRTRAATTGCSTSPAAR